MDFMGRLMTVDMIPSYYDTIKIGILSNECFKNTNEITK